MREPKKQLNGRQAQHAMITIGYLLEKKGTIDEDDFSEIVDHVGTHVPNND